MQALDGHWGMTESKALAARAAADPPLVEEIVEALWHDKESTRTRAADALMRLSEFAPALLEGYQPALLELFYGPLPTIMQWHVVLLVPRVRMSVRDRRRAFVRLKELLNEPGSLTRTAAIEGLARLGLADPILLEEATHLIRHALRGGTPAMRARARRWAGQIEQYLKNLPPAAP